MFGMAFRDEFVAMIFADQREETVDDGRGGQLKIDSRLKGRQLRHVLERVNQRGRSAMARQSARQVRFLPVGGRFRLPQRARSRQGKLQLGVRNDWVHVQHHGRLGIVQKQVMHESVSNQ